MSFYLVSIPEPGVETPLPNYGPYNTGPDAAFWAKSVSRKQNIKVLPRRFETAPDWRQQQKARLLAGELRALPKDWNIDPIPDHFAHLGAKNEFMVGYFAEPIHAVMNKATEVKPGVYLNRFYPHLHVNERKRLAGLVDFGDEVFFAKTEDEFEWVYENGPQSCMTMDYQRRSNGGKFNSPFHPVRAYAAGDFALAYMKSKSGSVSERCLCWPDRKVYSRIYGDGSGRLGKLLIARGFKAVDASGLNGGRLQRHLIQGSFVVPYFDPNGQVESRVRDDGEFIVVDTNGGTMAPNSTNGLIRAVVAQPQQLAA